MTSTLYDQIKDICQEIQQGANDALKAAIDKNARYGVKLLKEKSPKRSGVYAQGWKSVAVKKSDGLYEKVIKNKVYQLTWLLEYGHDVINNGNGVGLTVIGRAKAKPHISVVREILEKRIEADVESELDKRL